VEGYLQRFNEWTDVKREIARGRPVVASIRHGPGELSGLAFHSTAGHLIVICGFDEQGNVHVNDPAGLDAEQGVTKVSKDELAEAWFERGGVGYVFMGRIDDATSRAGISH
jgi:uncharacterized protein YvpB